MIYFLDLFTLLMTTVFYSSVFLTLSFQSHLFFLQTLSITSWGFTHWPLQRVHDKLSGNLPRGYFISPSWIVHVPNKKNMRRKITKLPRLETVVSEWLLFRFRGEKSLPSPMIFPSFVLNNSYFRKYCAGRLRWDRTPVDIEPWEGFAEGRQQQCIHATTT